MEQILIRKGGFRITFKNDYSIDVINGYGSYSENHYKTELFDAEETISKDCEIAILYKEEIVNPFDWNDVVKGEITPSELVEYINKVKKLK